MAQRSAGARLRRKPSSSAITVAAEMICAPAKIVLPMRALAACLAAALASVVVVRTWYVPDEYWQGVEMGAVLAGARGEATWEWQQARLRSPLAPAPYAALRVALQTLGFNSPDAHVEAPRIMQGLCTALASLARCNPIL